MSLLDLSTAERVRVADQDVQQVRIGDQLIWTRPTLYTPWVETRRNQALGSTGARSATTTGAISRTTTGSALRLTYTTQGNTAWWDALSIMPAVLQGTSGTAVDLPCAPGQVVRASCRYRSERLRPMRWRLTWRDAAHAALGATILVNSATPPNSTDWFTGPILEATAPAGAAFYRVDSNSQQPALSPVGFELGDWVELDQAQVTVDQALGAFFDGDTPDTELARHSWLGTPQASPSVMETREVLP